MAATAAPTASFCRAISALVRDERGIAAIEYALLCALIALAAIGGIANLGESAGKQWSDIEEAVAEASGDDGGNGKGKGKGKDKKDK